MNDFTHHTCLDTACMSNVTDVSLADGTVSRPFVANAM